MWAHYISVTFRQSAHIGLPRIWWTVAQDHHVGQHNILLVGGTTLVWANCMSITFGQLAHVGPPRIWQTAI
jgi:hypothetical protein